MNTKDDNAFSAPNLCGSSCSTTAPAPKPATNTSTTVVPTELHACMGLNTCRNRDRFGTNSCAGMGFCSTTQHVCHTLNNCRGQGGCGLYGTAAEQNKPGQNECAWKGSCATPIQEGRFSTQGDNKGQSVWVLARKLFEERLTAEGREFGEAPFKEGPPTWWLQTLGPFDACGSSGNPNCSFGGGHVLCGYTHAKKDR